MGGGSRCEGVVAQSTGDSQSASEFFREVICPYITVDKIFLGEEYQDTAVTVVLLTRFGVLFTYCL